MAKRKRFKTRTITRYRTMAKRKRSRKSFFGRKSYRRSSSGSLSPMKVIIPALVYGAVRSKAAEFATPITSKVPLGNYADEAVFGTVGYFMAKKGKGMVKNAGLAILTVEAASVGNQIAGNYMGGSSTSTAASQAWF